MEQQHLDNNNSGYVVLTSVILLGTVGLAVVIGLLLRGADSSKTSLLIQHSSFARAMANMCAEEALQQINDVITFTGTGTLMAPNGSCTYEVTSQGTQNRTIFSTGNASEVIRKVKLQIDKINPSINIVSWKEVADF